MSITSAGPSLAAADLFGVKGLVAVVTGGGTGIGLMMTKALEQNGAKVYIIGRREQVLRNVAAEEAKHGNIIPIQGDVSSKSDLERVTARIASETGYINLLVANAGITGPPRGDITLSGPEHSSLDEVCAAMWANDPARFNLTFSTNVGGPFWSVIAFAKLLEAGNKKGNVGWTSQVIATSSIGSYMRVPASNYAYNVSKAAVNHLMKQFSTTFAPYSIRFNTICPGRYPSELLDKIFDAGAELRSEQIAVQQTPLGRSGTQEDMAGAILFLASRAGAFVSGSTVVSDGGKLSVVPATYA